VRVCAPSPRPKVRKCFRSHDASHPWIVGSFLQRHGTAQRSADQNDGTGSDGGDDLPQVLFFVIPVGARIATRLAVRATVVRNNIEPALPETINQACSAFVIVRNAMQPDDPTATWGSRVASPTFQRDAGSGEYRRIARSRGDTSGARSLRVEEGAGADSGELPIAERAHAEKCDECCQRESGASGHARMILG